MKPSMNSLEVLSIIFVVEVGRARDDLALEALLEGLLGERVDVVGIAGVEAEDVRLAAPASST